MTRVSLTLLLRICTPPHLNVLVYTGTRTCTRTHTHAHCRHIVDCERSLSRFLGVLFLKQQQLLFAFLLSFYFGPHDHSLFCLALDALDVGMIDHISFATKHYEESVKFYDATLPSLGYTRVMTLEKPVYVAYGSEGRPCFWMRPATEGNEKEGAEAVLPTYGAHVSFSASKTEDIDSWYKACLAHGGQDNGAPGPRPIYHPGFYGAFIIDPNGWKIEACLHHWTKSD